MEDAATVARDTQARRAVSATPTQFASYAVKEAGVGMSARSVKTLRDGTQEWDVTAKGYGVACLTLPTGKNAPFTVHAGACAWIRPGLADPYLRAGPRPPRRCSAQRLSPRATPAP